MGWPSYLYLVYAISGFVVSALVYVRPWPVAQDSPGLNPKFVHMLNVCARFGLFLLGFGTGLDNSRLFAGGVVVVISLSLAQHANASGHSRVLYFTNI